MKKAFISILLLYIVFCFVGCATTQTDSNSSEDIKEKHVVVLTKENWEQYITIETVPYYPASGTTYYHYFRGALSYAYYDNVVVAYQLTESMSKSPYTITQTEKTLSLNAGGCGTITISNNASYYQSYTIENVSGTITYWI